MNKMKKTVLAVVVGMFVVVGGVGLLGAVASGSPAASQPEPKVTATSVLSDGVVAETRENGQVVYRLPEQQLPTAHQLRDAVPFPDPPFVSDNAAGAKKFVTPVLPPGTPTDYPSGDAAYPTTPGVVSKGLDPGAAPPRKPVVDALDPANDPARQPK